MRGLFIACALLGCWYFLAYRRFHDVFTVAFLGSVIYFIPGVFGEVVYPLGDTLLVREELAAGTYGTMLCVLMAIWSFSVLNRRNGHDKFTHGDASEQYFYTAETCLALSLIGLAGAFLTIGPAVLLSPNKLDILSETNRWAILWSTASPASVTLAYSRRRWFTFSVALILVFAEAYVGYRTGLAFSVMGCAIVYLLRSKGSLIFDHWRFLCACTGFVIALFVYKSVIYWVKTGDVIEIKGRLFDVDYQLNSFMVSEPFITQSILNEVVVNDYRVALAENVSGWLPAVTLYAPELGIDIPSFSDRVALDLFPAISWGIASNIWAEMLAMGSWFALIGFLAFYVGTLRWISSALRALSPDNQAFLAYATGIWAVYIHRNDLCYEIVLLKRVALLALISYALSRFLKHWHHKTDLQPV